MKLGITADEHFTKNLGEFAAYALPSKIAYSISKILLKVRKENQEYHRLRNEILKRYAVPNESGGISVSEKNEVVFKDEETNKKCLKDLADLYEVEIEIPKIKLSALPDDFEISPMILVALEPIVEEEV